MTPQEMMQEWRKLKAELDACLAEAQRLSNHALELQGILNWLGDKARELEEEPRD